jgi:radical SAM superfamily enzyme YgiQ (UPF0313 family)
MKILFITEKYIIDPLGIAWLSSYLKSAGHHVGLKVLEDRGDWRDVAQDPPDMLCYSVTTGKHNFYLKVNSGIRMCLRSDIVSVFGGPHVTFFPEYIHEQYMDYGIRGEGFLALLELANILENKGDVTDIQNLVTKEKVNPVRPSMSKERMLFPDRNLIYRRPENRNNPIKNVMCSFQCPANCPYCFNQRYKELHQMKGAEIRPVQEVIAEVQDLKRFPLELIFFQDDVFPVYNSDWLEEFVRCYKTLRIPFHVQLRAEYINDFVIAQLKSVGLHGVTFAIESGNAELRQKVLRRRMTNQMVVDAANILHKYDVKLRTENMVGFPGETWETALDTLELNIRCNPTIAWASLYQPYPGTELGDKCLEEGLFDGDLDTLSESFFESYKLDVPDKERFERLQKLFSLAVEKRSVRKRLEFMTSLPVDYSGIYKRTKNRLYKELYKVA